MKIIIAGGSGFIGQALVHYFLNKGWQCVVIGRNEDKIKKIFGNSVKALTWEQMPTKGLHEIKTADVVINLAGASIGEKRWTENRKKELLESRIGPTKILAELCGSLGTNSPPLFSADGVGIYGLQKPTAQGLPPAINEKELLNYENPQSFLEKIGHEWELATQPAKIAGTRVVNMRFGVVLGKNGGALQKLKLPFLFFIGGPIGNGKQPFSWIALADLLSAIDFLIAHPEISGPVNLVAPQVVTQKEFAKTLGKSLHRPSFIPTPAFFLQLIYGEMAKELLLSGQNVASGVLLAHNFQFKYPTIESALTALS